VSIQAPPDARQTLALADKAPQAASWPALGEDVSLEELKSAVNEHRPMVAGILGRAQAGSELGDVMDYVFSQAWQSLERWRNARDPQRPDTWNLAAWVGKVARDSALEWCRRDVPKRWADRWPKDPSAPIERRLVDLDAAAPELEGVARPGNGLTSGAMLDAVDATPGQPLVGALRALRALVEATPGGAGRWHQITTRLQATGRNELLRADVADWVETFAEGQAPAAGDALRKAGRIGG